MNYQNFSRMLIRTGACICLVFLQVLSFAQGKAPTVKFGNTPVLAQTPIKMTKSAIKADPELRAEQGWMVAGFQASIVFENEKNSNGDAVSAGPFESDGSLLPSSILAEIDRDHPGGGIIHLSGIMLKSELGSVMQAPSTFVKYED